MEPEPYAGPPAVDTPAIPGSSPSGGEQLGLKSPPGCPEPEPGPGNPPEYPEPGSSEEAPKWDCGACSFENHGLLQECEVCEAPRPDGGWYTPDLEGELTNASAVDQCIAFTACDRNTAVGAMLHCCALKALEDGAPPPTMGSFTADHIRICVDIIMNPYKWMKNPGGRLEGSRKTETTLSINGREALANGSVTL
jgi:hypothetical protein